MIKNKLYKCEDCGRLVRIRSKGKCTFCRSRGRKSPYPNPIRSAPQPTNTLGAFFSRMIRIKRGVSEESGVRIYNLNSSNICHIFPKRTYKSIAEDELNVIVLTLSEHSELDMLIDKRDLEKLKDVFPHVCSIIRGRLPILIDKMEESGGLVEFFKKL